MRQHLLGLVVDLVPSGQCNESQTSCTLNMCHNTFGARELPLSFEKRLEPGGPLSLTFSRGNLEQKASRNLEK